MLLQSWDASESAYPSQPSGDAVAIAQALVAKYATEPVAPATTYTRHPGTDAACTNCDLAHTWTQDVSVLMVLCNADPGCVGFVATGYLKNSTRTMAPNPISDLYVKNV